MIDIHSHIVFGVDDGAKSVEDSVSMLKAAKEAGIDTIIATPHYSRELHENGIFRKNFDLTSKEAEKYGIRLLPGYEARIAPDLPDETGNNREITLDGTEFLLVELPFTSIPLYTSNTLYMLRLKGITPVIAHPERNLIFAGNFKLFEEFAGSGYLMQADAASIAGKYGGRIRRFVKKAIKRNYIAFVASDAHNTAGYTEWYLKAYKKVKKWVGEEKTGLMFGKNAAGAFSDSLQHKIMHTGTGLK